MKNAAYVITLTTKRGLIWKHVKRGKDWTRTGPNGRVHRMTAEQLLSHLLPSLAGDQPSVRVGVQRKRTRKNPLQHNL